MFDSEWCFSMMMLQHGSLSAISEAEMTQMRHTTITKLNIRSHYRYGLKDNLKPHKASINSESTA